MKRAVIFFIDGIVSTGYCRREYSRRDRFQLCGGPFDRPAWFQTSYGCNPPRNWIVHQGALGGKNRLAADGDGDIKFLPNLQTMKAGRSDADDLKRMTVQGEFAPHHLRTSSKLALPESVTQHRRLRAAAAVIVRRGNEPAQQWLYAKYVEEISAHHEAVRVAGFASLAEVKPVRGPRGNLGECLLLIVQQVPERAGECGIR